MGILDRLRGAGVQRTVTNASTATTADDQAIERYRYLLRTAPPETIEAAHAEAFAQLTPEQRQRVLASLADAVPERERTASANAADDPRALARVATRAELRHPGTMERVFGGFGAAPGTAHGAPGMGSLLAGGFLSSMAGTVLGSMIAQHFMSSHAGASALFGPDGGSGALAGNDPFHTSDGLGATPLESGTGFDPGAAADADSFDSGDFDGGGFDGGGFDAGGDSFDV